MLFITFIFYTLVSIVGASAGSAIFRNTQITCWDERDIIKLRARKLFEDVLPQTIDPYKINDTFIKELIRYLRSTLKSADVENDPLMLKDIMADTLGAHLRNEILPAVRLAFYCGHISLRNAKRIHEFFDDIKQSLNTQGLGWQPPPRTQRWANITVSKICIPGRTIFDPCSNLVLKRDGYSCIHFPIPRLDDASLNPSALALPFKKGGLVSLTAPSSKNILLKYYVAATKCILMNSPNHCKETDIASLNLDLWNWMKRDVARHIQDEKLYTAFGGVLKVAAAVQANRFSKARRTLFEESYSSKQRPRDKVNPQTSKDSHWTSKMYIFTVIGIAASLFLIQLIWNKFCCSAESGINRGDLLSSFLQTKWPAPPVKAVPNIVNYTQQTKTWSKSQSMGAMRTQKVYDLNENTEKLMAIISGNEHSESSLDSDGEARKRSDSPPKLETSISEVKIDQQKMSIQSSSRDTRGTYEIQSKPEVYSSRDTAEQYDRHPSDSLWTVSESFTSRSESSSTSKDCGNLRRHLPLDKRVSASDTITSVKLSSNTEINLNSYTTGSEETK